MVAKRTGNTWKTKASKTRLSQDEGVEADRPKLKNSGPGQGHDLTVRALRLKRLEKWAAENTEVLTESQVQSLEGAKKEKEAHVEVEIPHPGFLLAKDTYYVGTIKGVVRIYQQTAIDTHANVGFAKVYRDKTAITAADLDDLMAVYNAERTNQGKYCQGRTPLQTFSEGLELYHNMVFDYGVEEREVAYPEYFMKTAKEKGNIEINSADCVDFEMVLHGDSL
jgi:hypothetical protein